MCNRYHVLAIAFVEIHVDIFASPLIEQLFMAMILVCDSAGQSPHSVAETDGWPLMRAPSSWSVACSTLLYTIEAQDSTYKFMAAKYRYLWIIGIDKCIFSKYI